MVKIARGNPRIREGSLSFREASRPAVNVVTP
jgi:hypothetical protein